MVMEQDSLALSLIFLSLLGGSIARAVYPFIQHQKQNEDTLRTLELIPTDKLTDEQKQFIETVSKPLNFHKLYMWTAIFGFVGTVTVSMTAFSALMASLPSNLPLSSVTAFLPMAFLAGWGGNSLSNQLLSSKNVVATSISNSIGSSIISKIIPPLPVKKEETS